VRNVSVALRDWICSSAAQQLGRRVETLTAVGRGDGREFRAVHRTFALDLRRTTWKRCRLPCSAWVARARRSGRARSVLQLVAAGHLLQRQQLEHLGRVPFALQRQFDRLDHQRRNTSLRASAVSLIASPSSTFSSLASRRSANCRR